MLRAGRGSGQRNGFLGDAQGRQERDLLGDVALAGAGAVVRAILSLPPCTKP